MAEAGVMVPLVRSSSITFFEDQTKNECRVILVGKTGNGKSSIGNRLLKRADTVAPFPRDATSEPQDLAVACPAHDQDGFEVSPWCFSCTKNCQFAESHVWDKELKVIDTPGIFATNEDIERTLIELSRCMSLSVPGPHAIVFVVRLDTKFTDEEENAFNEIVQKFGEGVKSYIIIAFTRGEILGSHRTKKDVKDLVSTVPKLKTVLEQANDRYIIFSNIETERGGEVRDLLRMIDLLRKENTDPFYHNEALRKQGEVIESKVKKLREKNSALTKEEALSQVRHEIARSDETDELLRNLVLITVGTATFCVLAGVTGGLIVEAIPELASVVGLGERAAAGVAIGGGFSKVYGKVVTFLKSKDKEQKKKEEEQEGEHSNRFCVVS